MTCPALRIHAGIYRGRPLLVIAGELDLDTAPQLQAALDTAVTRPAGILYLDMAGVSFCDCSGLNLLLRARARGPVRVCGARPNLLRLFTLTGTREMFRAPEPLPVVARTWSALAS